MIPFRTPLVGRLINKVKRRLTQKKVASSTRDDQGGASINDMLFGSDEIDGTWKSKRKFQTIQVGAAAEPLEVRLRGDLGAT